jgi:starch synthase (maltosyl-transferring)
VIESVTPEINGGRFPVKRAVGEAVVVEADVFADGHDELRCVLRYRRDGDETWSETEMQSLGNDRWRARFVADEMVNYCYTIEAWVDAFATWRRDTQKRIAAGQDVAGELAVGAEIVKSAAGRATRQDAPLLREVASVLSGRATADRVQELLKDPVSMTAVERYTDRGNVTRYECELKLTVDPPRAAFGAWYEMFPRSAALEAGRHGTFADVEARLPYVADMGFDVLYLPPIHPIGTAHRKGRNNATVAGPGDPGSPWAIGSAEGGHKSVHPQLGTLEDFRRLVDVAGGMGIAVALDIALQCSPDHPYVKEHPQWFRHRPDGSIRYAENPPKKYEDIYPFDFETADWRALWEEMKSIFEFWIEQGVRAFRVDNPHTKPFAFWEWLIREIKARHPDVIFLAEAFTRPRTMHYLAKLGFTQSYTYFTWRNTKWELIQYFTELCTPPVNEYMRPNVWPNTPDILNEYLQSGGPEAFHVRFILAATLAATYGIYGPAFELMESTPREHGSEEYLNSEKYELRHWDIASRRGLSELITRVNEIRRTHAALQSNRGLRFHHVDNEHIICYSKETEDAGDVIVSVVNLQPSVSHASWVYLSVTEWGIGADEEYEVHDLLDGSVYNWRGSRNFVKLGSERPAHIFQVVRRGAPGWRSV